MNETTQDRQRSVEATLQMQPDLSDDIIANRCGVGRELVQQLRSTKSTVPDLAIGLPAPACVKEDHSNQCPHCGSHAVSLSHRGVIRILAVLGWFRPLHCQQCGRRFYRFRGWTQKQP